MINTKMPKNLVIDTIIRIKNGWMRKNPEVQICRSKVVDNCLYVLENIGCIKIGNKQSDRYQVVNLIYDNHNETTFTSFKAFRKQTMLNVREIANIIRLKPQDEIVLSTNQGIITGSEAIKKHIGGIALFAVRR